VIGDELIAKAMSQLPYAWISYDSD